MGSKENSDYTLVRAIAFNRNAEIPVRPKTGSIMSVQRSRDRRFRARGPIVRAGVVGVFGIVSLLLAGCPMTPGSTAINEDVAEPNDTFPRAVEVSFDESGKVALAGSIGSRGDIDVFRLGALEAGTMITVDAATTTSALDITVAVFDADENLVYANDDRGGSLNRALDSYVLWTTRHASDPYYLVVAASAFAASGQMTGSYTIDVETVPDMGVPPPAGQTILLDFSGAMVDSPVLGTFQLDPFDAAKISADYAGQTDRMKQLIADAVRQNFERFDVTIYTTDDNVTLDPSTTSTVYLGGYDAQVFGLADDVDEYNADPSDDAIIYTESFNPDQVFTFTPTVEEMAVAIGNIAAHEAGHLLGLFHVSDDLALMDATSPADAFIEDQEFKRAPLSGDVVDIGSQDAAALLYEIVGPK